MNDDIYYILAAFAIAIIYMYVHFRMRIADKEADMKLELLEAELRLEEMIQQLDAKTVKGIKNTAGELVLTTPDGEEEIGEFKLINKQ